MKRRKVDGGVERNIVTALITSDEFLGRVASGLDTGLLEAPHLRIVAKWCVRHFLKYRKAPKRGIETMYASWAERTGVKEEVVEAVGDLLAAMSVQYEAEDDINVPHLVDVAAEHFSKARLRQIAQEVENSLAAGNVEAAEAAVSSYVSKSFGVGGGLAPLDDESVWTAAFSESQRPLIKFGDENADIFFRRALTRDALVGILGPEKRGKTWWCLEFAFRALACRKRVAFFEVGDLSEAQIMRRIGARLCARPLQRRDLGEIAIPTKISRDDERVPECTYRYVTKDKIARETACIAAAKRFVRARGLSSDVPYLLLSVHPNSSINVAGIDSILRQWEQEKRFVPDVIIIDYPDILAPEPGNSNMLPRDQVNETWKALRRLSQIRHCLVLAPTQGTRDSYKAEVIRMEHSSEDKRKLAHVTGMIGLNQTPDEKDGGLMRLNWVVLRESEFSPRQCLTVAQCLVLGRAFCCACF